MAANIREVAGWKPGVRVLVIVGSAHKPWLDHYFRQMTDVRIVNAEAVLR
jgi:bifunctional DNA-binding transcriptional regulator/antitoxin component of YhaV-PrlF toxin-antitoxin module